MLGLPLDHVAVAVASIDEATPAFERLTGSRATPVESLEGQRVRVAFVGALELLEPTHPDTPVGRFLQKRGSGLHHIAYRTEDLVAELARARAAGFEPIDAEPRTGARGHRVAFLHPRSTGGVLIELVEHAARRP
jgi:methylmalonyl-CoA/ethylmalonyl-CoA epimerase